MAKAIKTKDFCVRAAICKQLMLEGIDRKNIRHELTMDSNSHLGRVDMVLLHDTFIGGIEIKSESDTVERLGKQLLQMRRTFDKLGIVADKKHHSNDYCHGAEKVYHCGTQGFVRHHWRADRDGGSYFTPYDGGGFLYSAMFSMRRGSEYTSVLDMAQLLWKKEADEVAAALRIQRKTRHDTVQAFRENVSLAELRPLVIQQLRARVLNNWEINFWKKYDERPVA